ncbi:MAG: hypothetical protein PVF69_08045 [Gemmatimonadota bacterium]|jgi:hypothetical protein
MHSRPGFFRWSASALLGLLPALVAAPAAAQSLEAVRVAAPELLIPAPYADPESAIRLASKLEERDPESVELRLVVAREATALGLLSGSPEERDAWLVRSEGAAREAVALRPEEADANYWLAAALGLRADVAGGRSKITLAREAYEVAQHTLELDSLHAGANHIVGRLHAGAKRLSWLNRMIARALGLGEILGEASWESAERHMRIAAEREPDELVHLHDLGKLLLEQRLDVEQGRAILQDVAGRSPRHDLDALYIGLSREALSELSDR